MSMDLSTAIAEELVDPLRRDSQSVGVVRTQYATLFEPPHKLTLAAGAKLGPIRVAYETYGELSAARDNAVFVCHALTGDAHVAGLHAPTDRKPGWWDELVGPGKGLDTNRYFVICANILGGCQGTTGPNSIDPRTGKPYGLRLCPFPPAGDLVESPSAILARRENQGVGILTVGDFVEVHSALVKHLGIEKLLAVIGGSLGGMQVLEWAARFPEQIRAAICLASAARLSAQGIAFNCVGRRAIVTDPNFFGGDFYDKPAGPNQGLALARMVAHITYLSDASIEKKFGRRLQHADRFAYELLHETEFQVESYLHHQGSRFVERFDANSYLYLTRAMDYYDLAESYGSLEKGLGRTDARFLITSYTTDWLFPTIQSRELVDALVAARRHVSFVELASPFGHDSFLLEVEPLEELLMPFLEQAHLAARKKAP